MHGIFISFKLQNGDTLKYIIKHMILYLKGNPILQKLRLTRFQINPWGNEISGRRRDIETQRRLPPSVAIYIYFNMSHYPTISHIPATCMWR